MDIPVKTCLISGMLKVVILVFFGLWFSGLLAEDKQTKRNAALVNVEDHLPEVIVDLQYAKSDNIAKKQLYASPVAFLHPDTISRLKPVVKMLRKQGFKLVILDAYRPPDAHKKLFDSFPNQKFIADPKLGSRHSRGTSVDVTLADMEGTRLEMPSDFDEFTPRADNDFRDATPTAFKHVKALRVTMFKNGFSGVPDEWWHYDLRNWSEYPFIRTAPLNDSRDEYKK